MLKPNSLVTTNLIKARELIADEKNWCRWAYHNRRRVCAKGAVLDVADGPDITEALQALDVLTTSADEILRTSKSAARGTCPIVTVNDLMGHAAVMKMFDRAIELSLQEPSP